MASSTDLGRVCRVGQGQYEDVHAIVWGLLTSSVGWLWVQLSSGKVQPCEGDGPRMARACVWWGQFCAPGAAVEHCPTVLCSAVHGVNVMQLGSFPVPACCDRLHGPRGAGTVFSSPQRALCQLAVSSLHCLCMQGTWCPWLSLA